jgi:hypothetical protein
MESRCGAGRSPFSDVRSPILAPLGLRRNLCWRGQKQLASDPLTVGDAVLGFLSGFRVIKQAAFGQATSLYSCHKVPVSVAFRHGTAGRHVIGHHSSTRQGIRIRCSGRPLNNEDFPHHSFQAMGQFLPLNNIQDTYRTSTIYRVELGPFPPPCTRLRGDSQQIHRSPATVPLRLQGLASPVHGVMPRVDDAPQRDLPD